MELTNFIWACLIYVLCLMAKVSCDVTSIIIYLESSSFCMLELCDVQLSPANKRISLQDLYPCTFPSMYSLIMVICGL
jgi:hypothetical protein